VTVCPEVMLLELALIETVGTAAAALAAKNETANKGRKRVRRIRKGIVFTWACLRGLVHLPDCALEGEVFPAGWRPSHAGYDSRTDPKTFDAAEVQKGSNPDHCIVVTSRRTPWLRIEVLFCLSNPHSTKFSALHPRLPFPSRTPSDKLLPRPKTSKKARAAPRWERPLF
jgi:hypothetical protein